MPRLFRRHLFSLGRDDFLHSAAPAIMCQIENDAVWAPVFDLVEGVRIIVRPAAKTGGARIGHFLRCLFEIVDPHPEMNEAVIPLGKTGNLVIIFQKRYIDGAIRHITADSRFADALHAEGVLEKFCRFFGIRNGQSDMTKPSGHGILLSILASASAGPWGASRTRDSFRCLACGYFLKLGETV